VRLRVLGSAGGWPGAGRACSGYLLEAAGHRIWLDAGPGTFAELLRHHTIGDLDAIWITHLHPDHCSDLLTVRTFVASTAARLPVFGPPGWADRMDAFLGRPGAMAAAFETVELADRVVHPLGPLHLEAVAMHHHVPAFGLRVTADGVTFAYTGDSGPGPAVESLAAGADLLLAEAFLAVAGLAEDPYVSTPEAAAATAGANQVGHLVLTHLHPDADPVLVRQRAAAVFDGRLDLARPGDVYEAR
jgi:ribonuclease BN (tRNA processing enzyme)